MLRGVCCAVDSGEVQGEQLCAELGAPFLQIGELCLRGLYLGPGADVTCGKARIVAWQGAFEARPGLFDLGAEVFQRFSRLHFLACEQGFGEGAGGGLFFAHQGCALLE